MRRLYPTLLVLVLASTGHASSEIAVIVHESVPAVEIGQPELLDLTVGDKSFWSDGSPVILFDLQRKDEIRRSYFRFLGIRSSRVKSIWMKRVLSGDAEPPEALTSQEEMLNRVATTPGAMGFVDLSKVAGDVRVVIVLEKE